MIALWDKVAYMAQLLVACFVFMHPIQKKEYYAWRIVASTAFFLFVAYVINYFDAEAYFAHLGIMGMMLYWFGFLLFCVVHVWFCAEASLSEIVYCVCCASAMQHTAYDLYQIYFLLIGKYPIVYVLIYIAVYSAYYYFFARKLALAGRYRVVREDIFPLVTILLFVCLLTILERNFQIMDANAMNCVIYLLADGLCCYHILWGQVRQQEKMQLQKELDGINYVWCQQKEQYRVTQETIDIINRKCHDLRHQLSGLYKLEDEEERSRYLKEMEDAVMIYETAVKTGNAALDTVLMEKGLLCHNQGIYWTCMADDGSLLNFIEAGDIYAMFGNAIDNAIAAVMKLQDKEKRVISARVFHQQNALMIQIQNYYEGELEFIDGLPKTTEVDKYFHGYGMKSLRYTAEKYNGTMVVTAENQIFTVNILLPLPIESVKS